MPPIEIVDGFPSYLLDVNAIVIAFIIGIAIPWLTELVTHASAPDWLRSILNFALSALAGVLTTVIFAEFQTVGDYLLAIAVTWLATMRAYYAGMAKPVATSTAHMGIGGPSTTTRDDTVYP